MAFVGGRVPVLSLVERVRKRLSDFQIKSQKKPGGATPASPWDPTAPHPRGGNGFWGDRGESACLRDVSANPATQGATRVPAHGLLGPSLLLSLPDLLWLVTKVN